MCSSLSQGNNILRHNLRQQRLRDTSHSLHGRVLGGEQHWRSTLNVSKNGDDRCRPRRVQIQISADDGFNSTEAENMAFSLCTQKVHWACAMLKALGHEQVEATWIWEDNQGATGILSNA